MRILNKNISLLIIVFSLFIGVNYVYAIGSIVDSSLNIRNYDRETTYSKAETIAENDDKIRTLISFTVTGGSLTNINIDINYSAGMIYDPNSTIFTIVNGGVVYKVNNGSATIATNITNTLIGDNYKLSFKINNLNNGDKVQIYTQYIVSTDNSDIKQISISTNLSCDQINNYNIGNATLYTPIVLIDKAYLYAGGKAKINLKFPYLVSGTTILTQSYAVITETSTGYAVAEDVDQNNNTLILQGMNIYTLMTQYFKIVVDNLFLSSLSFKYWISSNFNTSGSLVTHRFSGINILDYTQKPTLLSAETFSSSGVKLYFDKPIINFHQEYENYIYISNRIISDIFTGSSSIYSGILIIYTTDDSTAYVGNVTIKSNAVYDNNGNANIEQTVLISDKVSPNIVDVYAIDIDDVSDAVIINFSENMNNFLDTAKYIIKVNGNNMNIKNSAKVKSMLNYDSIMLYVENIPTNVNSLQVIADSSIIDSVGNPINIKNKLCSTNCVVNSNVIISGVMPNTSNGIQKIELMNKTNNTINLSGFTILNNSRTLNKKLDIYINGFSYYTVEFTGSLINNTDDSLFLLNTDDRIISNFTYGNFNNGNVNTNSPSPSIDSFITYTPKSLLITNVDTFDFNRINTRSNGMITDLGNLFLRNLGGINTFIKFYSGTYVYSDENKTTLYLGILYSPVNNDTIPTGTGIGLNYIPPTVNSNTGIIILNAVGNGVFSGSDIKSFVAGAGVNNHIYFNRHIKVYYTLPSIDSSMTYKIVTKNKSNTGYEYFNDVNVNDINEPIGNGVYMASNNTSTIIIKTDHLSEYCIVNTDLMPPTVNINPNSQNYNSNFVVAISVSDTGGSGVKGFYYTDNGADPNISSNFISGNAGTINVTTAGMNYGAKKIIKVKGIDNANNLSNTYTVEYTYIGGQTTGGGGGSSGGGGGGGGSSIGGGSVSSSSRPITGSSIISTGSLINTGSIISTGNIITTSTNYNLIKDIKVGDISNIYRYIEIINPIFADDKIAKLLGDNLLENNKIFSGYLIDSIKYKDKNNYDIFYLDTITSISGKKYFVWTVFDESNILNKDDNVFVNVNIPTVIIYRPKFLYPFYDMMFHWAREYVYEFYVHNIVQGFKTKFGYEFRPDIDVTRAEFAKVFLNVNNISIDDSYKNFDKFVDVKSNDWYAPYVYMADKLGIMNGYDIDGKKEFRPNTPINRAEIAKVILTYLKSTLIKNSNIKFIDVEEGSWYQDFVNTLAYYNIISGYNIDGQRYYKPSNGVKRGEMVKILYRLRK